MSIRQWVVCLLGTFQMPVRKLLFDVSGHVLLGKNNLLMNFSLRPVENSLLFVTNIKNLVNFTRWCHRVDVFLSWLLMWVKSDVSSNYVERFPNYFVTKLSKRCFIHFRTPSYESAVDSWSFLEIWWSMISRKWLFTLLEFTPQSSWRLLHTIEKSGNCHISRDHKARFRCWWISTTYLYSCSLHHPLGFQFTLKVCSSVSLCSLGLLAF